MKKWLIHPLDPNLLIYPASTYHFAIIDAIDENLVKTYNWYSTIRDKGKQIYVVSSQIQQNNEKITIYLHKLIAEAHGIDTKEEIDHIDNNGLNNTIKNLRAASKSENQFNTRINKTNTSGIKGVGWDKKNNKWTGKVGYKRKSFWLGRFDNKDDAEAAVVAKRLELHESFANNG